jgi:putative intracellular protease/amidase
MSKMLIVVTSADEYQKVGYRTGLWLGELTHFYDVTSESGYDLDIVSLKGGVVPIDPESLMLSEIGEAVGLHTAVLKRYRDRQFMDKLRATRKVAEVSHEPYDAIYLTGGHGVMFDFKEPDLQNLVRQFFEAGKVVSAVCHGPCGLLDVKLTSGDYLLSGRKVTGFSWAEEESAKRDQAVPYSLEDELKARGAEYTKHTIPFAEHVVVDEKLVTGQNPGSAHGVGKAVLKVLDLAAKT